MDGLILNLSAILIVTGIKIATIAVLFTSAEARPIERKYTALPRLREILVSLLILLMRYSKMPVFCKAWLRINRSAIVTTAGLESPEIASEGSR